MRIRPGTIHFGSSLNDTGAQWVEFVSATDDVALIELTSGTMRVWIGDDAHSLALLGRPRVDTTVSHLDTGWEETSIGTGLGVGSTTDIIPTMTGPTTDGVTVTASSENTSGTFGGDAYHAVDDSTTTFWQDTGVDNKALPSWINIDFGAANTQSVRSYSVRAPHFAGALDNAPVAWRLITGDHDTGTFATDTGKWTLEDERSNETGWSISEKRTFTVAGADTGTIEARRHWRLFVTEVDTGVQDGSQSLEIAELEMFTATTTDLFYLQSGKRFFNAVGQGNLARGQKRVFVDTGDQGVEHSLDVYVERGPVSVRIGSSSGDDDYLPETLMETGYHNLAFTPSNVFHVTLQSDAIVDRIVSSLSIGDSGTLELTSPWTASDLDNIRYDQSADVVYLAAPSVQPRKIQRRGLGRSWSIVDYETLNGPFLTARSSSAKLSVSHFYGNTTMESDVPFFKSSHVGAIFQLTHDGQTGEWVLGAQDAVTDPVKVFGINDTGQPKTASNERRIVFEVAGTWSGTIEIERSFDGPDFGFKRASSGSGGVNGNISDTGTFTTTIDDGDDNLQVWYRAKLISYTSGTPVVRISYRGGQVTGVAKVVSYNNNQSVDVEIVKRVSDTGPTQDWQEGYWSDVQGYPTAVSLHGGRLFFANGANLFGSVSDDFENFDQLTEGDAGPIIRTLGSGPVDNIHYLVSLLRLIVGTSGAEIAIRSSSLDEPLTPDNSNARTFSTQGSADLRAVKLDTRAIMVQRSKQRVFMIGFGVKGDALGDYEGFELTLLVPDLLAAGIVSIAIQRQPDTRIHCVLADGKVAILTYEPQEEVICWSLWETDGSVTDAMVLPGVAEDAVYYHVERTINGQHKCYLEKWALESESIGDTGLSYLADCAASYTDTGRTATISGFSHLAGANVVVWADDTGQTNAGKDLSPGVSDAQTTYAVDTGAGTITLGEDVHHAVAGLPYTATWGSTKLAYAAEFGTALAQYKRVTQIGLILQQAHNNALTMGGDTGHLDPLPRTIDDGGIVDADKIYPTLDAFPTPLDGTWDEDSRFVLRAQAPRPITILACTATVETSEKV